MYSVRRRLLLGVWLVLAMVAVLTVSSLWAILSYRDVVNDLDRLLNRVPQRGEIVEALAALHEPLQPKFARTADTRIQRQRLFAERLEAVEKQTQRTWRKLADLPPSREFAPTKAVVQQRLEDIGDYLHAMQLEQPRLAAEESTHEAAAKLQMLVAETLTAANGLPEIGTGLNGLLSTARETNRAGFGWVTGSTLVVFALLGSFVLLARRWIFKPWGKLLEGTSRVAQGKFEYRVRLNTNDEFAELADSFNRMTDRFVEIRDDLDRQVRERSDQLLRQERLAGLGFLSAGIAHEINNPLTAIRWTSESLLTRLATLAQNAAPSDKALAENYLKMIQSEAARCQQITGKLLEFARGGDGQRSRQDLSQIIREVIQLVRAMSKYRQCAIVFDRTEPCFADVNGAEIKQVVLNLVANALDAIEDAAVAKERRPRLAGPNSESSVSTAATTPVEPLAIEGRVEIRLAEFTDHVELEFQDTGCGMTADVLQKIFDPFYTTKEVGHGTGLGLSISHRIVADHGGRLAASSNGPGHGSTFRLSLPRAVQSQDAAA